jgi:hypothetical protein
VFVLIQRPYTYSVTYTICRHAQWYNKIVRNGLCNLPFHDVVHKKVNMRSGSVALTLCLLAEHFGIART